MKRVIFDEPIQFIERIRDGLNHEPSGSLYLWTDQGNIYRAWPTAEAWKLVNRSKSAYQKNVMGVGLDDAEEKSPLDGCMECHTGVGTAPPRLKGILGKAIAGNKSSAYSPGLAGKGGIWNKTLLKKFLKNPEAFAPGSSMPDQGLKSDDQLNGVINAIVELSEGRGPGG